MRASEIREEMLNDGLVDRLLFCGIPDDGENADCAIVLGSSKAAKYRVPVAAKLYHAGRVPKVMLCGGALRDFGDVTESEAQNMKKRALTLGIPEADLILEENSQNTIENLLFAMVELQRNLWLNRVKKVFLVTTTYHMRRSLLAASYLFPDHIQVIPCPAEDNTTTRENWMNSEKGRTRVEKEAKSLLQWVENGVIPDFEI
ncbi:MAG: YdcF family protein [Clostridia bacterium]|nr:YdcF family protein [Clostridia bacterium]